MLNFLLVPLHTINTFNKEEYGTVTKLFAFVAFVNVIYLFGMETAFFRFSTKEGADRKQVFNLAQTVILSISVTLSIVFILFADSIAASLGASVKADYVIWLSIIMLIDAAVAIPFAKLRLENKALLFATGKVINVLLLLGLSYYFLKVSYNPAIGIGYVFLANLISNAFFILFFLKTLFRWRPAYDKVISGEMFRYAYPVMLTGVAGMTNEMFSRLTLEWWLPKDFYVGQSNEAAVGVFGAAYKFAVFMNLGVQAFRYAAEPFFFSHASDKKSPELFARVNHYFIIVCCFVFVAISINMDVLKYFTGKEYWEGFGIVPILLMAYLFLGIYYNFSVWFKLTDKTHYGTWITLGGAVVTILANYLLIPHFGYLGSSWAALICYAFMTIACYAFGQRFYPIPYELGKSFAYLITSVAIVYAMTFVQLENIFISTAIKLGLLIVLAGIVYILERKNLQQLS